MRQIVAAGRPIWLPWAADQREGKQQCVAVCHLIYCVTCRIREAELAAVAGFRSGDVDIAAVRDMRERRYPAAEVIQQLAAYLHRARAALGCPNLQVRICSARVFARL